MDVVLGWYLAVIPVSLVFAWITEYIPCSRWINYVVVAVNFPALLIRVFYQLFFEWNYGEEYARENTRTLTYLSYLMYILCYLVVLTDYVRGVKFY